MRKLSKRWPFVVGGVLILWQMVYGAIKLGGDIDFIVARQDDLGWVKSVLSFLLTPPPWIIFPTVIVAFLLISWGLFWRRPPRSARGLMAKKKLLHLTPEKRDAQLGQGYFYVMLGRWVRSPNEQSWPITGGVLIDALSTIRQAAFDGLITIWGKNGKLWVPMPREFWGNNKLTSAVINFDSPSESEREPLTESTDDQSTEQHKFLMCSKAQFERLDWQAIRVS